MGWVLYWGTIGQRSHRLDIGLISDIHVRFYGLCHRSILGGYVPVQQGCDLGQSNLCLSGYSTCDIIHSGVESE